MQPGFLWANKWDSPTLLFPLTNCGFTGFTGLFTLGWKQASSEGYTIAKGSLHFIGHLAASWKWHPHWLPSFLSLGPCLPAVCLLPPLTCTLTERAPSPGNVRHHACSSSILDFSVAFVK